MTDFTTLTPIKESIEETTEMPTSPTVSITPLNPPIDPPTPELALQPVTPSDPPLPPKQMGIQTFHRIKQKFQFLFK
jgi:hypothetical protein